MYENKRSFFSCSLRSLPRARGFSANLLISGLDTCGCARRAPESRSRFGIGPSQGPVGVVRAWLFGYCDARYARWGWRRRPCGEGADRRADAHATSRVGLIASAPRSLSASIRGAAHQRPVRAGASLSPPRCLMPAVCGRHRRQPWVCSRAWRPTPLHRPHQPIVEPQDLATP